ncbi:MAG: hypothetical protein JWM64_2981 [Frankiales bacterium]|nr:hypothetical protein [Frankiales bacterium]
MTQSPTPEQVYDLYRYAEKLLREQPAEAARVLAPLVEVEPGSTQLLELYARALFGSAQLGRAETALRELVVRRPDDGWARLALSRTLQRRGEVAEAAEHLRVAEALGAPV